MDNLDFENLTAESLAEGIKAIYKAYEQMTRNMSKEERKGFDKDLKEIINDKKIF